MPQTYQQRVTDKIPGYLASHPGATVKQARAFLRGHAYTPEHGHGPLGDKANKRQILADREILPTYSDRSVIAEINRAAESGKRVSISFFHGGSWHTVGAMSRGYSATYLTDLIAAFNGDLRLAVGTLVGNAIQSGYGKKEGVDYDFGLYDMLSELEPAPPGANRVFEKRAWQITTFEEAPTVRK